MFEFCVHSVLRKRRLLFSLAGAILTFFACFSFTFGEKLVEKSYVGYALGLGPAFWPGAKLRYRNTTIGTIEFPCRTRSATFSIMAFYKGEVIPGYRRLWQLELGASWVQEKGTKRWTLQGYPATAESEMRGIVLGVSLIFHHLQVWRVWVGSGLHFGLGAIDERFRIDLRREGQELSLFDPPSDVRFATRLDYIVATAKTFEGFWGSWELQLGYSDVDARRDNEFGGFKDRNPNTKTHTSGWYVRIRKLLLFDFNWNRVVEVKPEEG